MKTAPNGVTYYDSECEVSVGGGTNYLFFVSDYANAKAAKASIGLTAQVGDQHPRGIGDGPANQNTNTDSIVFVKGNLALGLRSQQPNDPNLNKLAKDLAASL